MILYRLGISEDLESLKDIFYKRELNQTFRKKNEKNKLLEAFTS